VAKVQPVKVDRTFQGMSVIAEGLSVARTSLSTGSCCSRMARGWNRGLAKPGLSDDAVGALHFAGP